MDQLYAVLNVFLQIFKVNIESRLFPPPPLLTILPPHPTIGNFKMHSGSCKSFWQANGAGNSCPFISLAYQKYRRRWGQGQGSGGL